MLEQPEIIKINGKDYKVEGFTGEIQSHFERFMESESINLIRESKNSLSSNEYLDLLKRHFWDVKHGNYSFCSEKFYEFINLKIYFLELMFWCFSKHFTNENSMTKDDLQKWIDQNEEECSLLYQRLLSTIKKK